MKELQVIVGRLCASEARSVLATLVTVEGSSYRRPGARMLVSEGGERTGSISGGCLEEDLAVRCARVAASGRAELAVYDTFAENDLLWGVGLGCRGLVRILVEPIGPRPPWAALVAANLREGRASRLEVAWSGAAPLGTRPGGDGDPGNGVFAEIISAPNALFIFGAGDDAIPLARQACDLGWRVTVCDSRPAMLEPARFPGAAGLVLGSAEELVSRASPRAGSLAVVMTHRYADDVPLLRGLVGMPLAYLGLLGPKIRAERILAELETAGVAMSPETRARLRAPAGLDIGAEEPDAIALSIMAEMSATLSGRDARPLRERTLSIHA